MSTHSLTEERALVEPLQNFGDSVNDARDDAVRAAPSLEEPLRSPDKPRASWAEPGTASSTSTTGWTEPVKPAPKEGAYSITEEKLTELNGVRKHLDYRVHTQCFAVLVDSLPEF